MFPDFKWSDFRSPLYVVRNEQTIMGKKFVRQKVSRQFWLTIFWGIKHVGLKVDWFVIPLNDHSHSTQFKYTFLQRPLVWDADDDEGQLGETCLEKLLFGQVALVTSSGDKLWCQVALVTSLVHQRLSTLEAKELQDVRACYKTAVKKWTLVKPMAGFSNRTLSIYAQNG